MSFDSRHFKLNFSVSDGFYESDSIFIIKSWTKMYIKKNQRLKNEELIRFVIKLLFSLFNKISPNEM